MERGPPIWQSRLSPAKPSRNIAEATPKVGVTGIAVTPTEPRLAGGILSSAFKPRGTFRRALDWVLEARPAGRPRNRILWASAGAALVIMGTVALAGWWRSTRLVERPLVRLSVDLGPEAIAGVSTTAAISSDGQRLVFPANGPDGKQQLASRLLDHAEAA